ncbi:MAG: CBS domain-containing protein [Deferrisomatales bacterium]|nr:CBS domain-containing protein [Deferrisomatales bacterium]
MKTAREIMTRDVHTVPPELSLQDLARAFDERRVSGFPVLDGDGKLVGVVTETDLIHQNQRLHIPTAVAIFDAVVVLSSSRKLEEEMRRVAATTVGEIMTRAPVTVGEDATVEEIATVMGEQGVHTLPVLGPEGQLAGVIGKRDVIRAMASP